MKKVIGEEKESCGVKMLMEEEEKLEQKINEVRRAERQFWIFT